MHFNILERPWARVLKDFTGNSHITAAMSIASICEHSVRPHALTVDRPLCVAVCVADGDGEATIVGTYHIDYMTRLTRDVQLHALTCISRAVCGLTLCMTGSWLRQDQEKE